MTERKSYESLLSMSDREVRVSWHRGLKKVNKENWRKYADGLCRITLPKYAEEHFAPEDVAYIEKMFKLYSQKYFYALIEALVANSEEKPKKESKKKPKPKKVTKKGKKKSESAK